MTLYIILMTLYLLSRDHMMNSNLTIISSLSEYRLITIIHVIITTLFYYMSLYTINKKMNHTSKYIRYMIHLSSILMIIGITIPFSEPGYDILSRLHVYLCMSSSLIYLILLLYYNYYFLFHDYNIYKNTHIIIDSGFSILAILMIFIGHINSYIEILLCIIMTLYLYLVKKHMNIRYNFRNKDY